MVGIEWVRVAIDARLLAYQSAGTATYIRGVVQGLRATRSEDDLVLIVSRRDPHPEELPATTRKVAWTPCHHRFERWALGIELAPLAVEVLHSPDFIPPVRLGRRWARVTTVHDLAFLRYPELLTGDSRRYYGQISRASVEAERIIAVSETTRQDLLTLVDPSLSDKIVVIPEGVDADFAPIDPVEAARRLRERYGVARPFFLFVGTIEPRKNLGRLIRAFGVFRERVKRADVDLLIAGARGWLSDDLADLAAASEGSVRFLGRVDRATLIELYNAALALVLVSLYEGFGLPALEAMACGRPTLVSNAGSLPDLVGTAGLQVNPTDEEQIAAAFERLWIDGALRDELGQRGAARAAAFNWCSVARQTAEVYAQAAACAS